MHICLLPLGESSIQHVNLLLLYGACLVPVLRLATILPGCFFRDRTLSHETLSLANVLRGSTRTPFHGVHTMENDFLHVFESVHELRNGVAQRTGRHMARGLDVAAGVVRVSHVDHSDFLLRGLGEKDCAEALRTDSD